MAQERRIVIAFGRFNPPTTGHEALALFLIKTARRLNAEARIYPSPTTDSKKNPLPFREKVGFLRQLFPQVTINDNPAINNPFAAFADVSAAGYKDITVVVGADRVRDFEDFAAYLLPASSSKYNTAKHIDVTQYHVLSIPRGVGAISASLMRGYVVANDFPSFLAGTPGKNITVAKKIFSSLRQHMHIREQRDYRDKMRQKIQEATVASSLKKGTYAVVAIENNKVLPNSMAWDFNETEIVLYANMLRAKHPHATISIEAAGGRVSQVLKPGDKIITSMFGEAHEVVPSLKEARMPLKGHPYHKKSDAELRYIIKDAGAAALAMRGHNRAAEDKYVDQVNDAQTVLYYRKNGGLREATHEVELKPGTRVKTPHGRGKIVRYDKGDGPHGSPYYIVDVGKHASEKVMAHQLQREETMIGPGSRVKTPYGIGQVVRYDKGEGHYIVDVGKKAYAKVTPPTWIVGQTKKVKPNQIQRWSEQREETTMSAPKPPSDVDRLKVRQATDTITLKQRQATELMAAKIRDVETKARAAQTKATAPKGAGVSAS